MPILDSTFGDFTEVFQYMWQFFLRGGWIAVVFMVTYILYRLYKTEITHQFVAEQQWVFLNIRLPRENIASTLAAEQIYSQMHALHTSLTFANIYVEGKVQLWYSLEIISLGGRISMIIRCPLKTRDLVEAAFYNEYPQAEIVEVEDYMKNIDFDPETSDFDLWGCDWKLLQDDVIPIRTYKEFEHPNAEEKIIDPLGPTFESLAKMQPWEFYGIQILIQPLADNEWKPRAQAKADELLGKKPAHAGNLLQFLLTPIHAFADFKFSSLFEHEMHEERPNTGFMALPDVDKERINGVLTKAGKPGYQTKIRHLYIAPKDKYDGTKKSILIGAMRGLGSAQLNGFKPDTKYTWTGLEYKISPDLEKPYIKREEKKRKRRIFKAYKERDWHVGIPQFVMNIEEIATLYHLPLFTAEGATQPQVETVSMKKTQAPADLPIGDYE